MNRYKIFDTNVLIAANGRKTHADLECQLSCIEAIESTKSGITLLDNMGLILNEYSRYCNYKGEPGVGDTFFKYIVDNQLVGSVCEVVEITPDSENNDSFTEFPNQDGLENFDPSDKKFVAVSVASGKSAPIYNATDSDWEISKLALEKNDIFILQLCPQHAKKQDV